MAEKTLYHVAFARSGNNGKTHWQRLGVLLHNPDKPHPFSIHLDALPAGEWDGWLSCFIKTDDDNRSPGRSHSANPADEDNADYPNIPF
jgi:hypothetical protein